VKTIQKLILILVLFVLGPLMFMSLSISAQSDDTGAVERELKKSELCSSILETLKPGDLVFIAIDQFLFKKVAASTRSWTSHVGVALPDASGHLWIYESKVLWSQRSDVCEFVDRSANQQAVVRRLATPLSQQNVQGLLGAAESRLNRLYDLGFNLDSQKMFCSRYVYEIFREVMGIEVGKVQTFQQLLDENPDPELKRFWQYWFLGFVPWERRTVTPVSQLLDPKFTTVLANGVAAP